MGEILQLKELLQKISKAKVDMKTIVTTNGCFDIIHAGHVRYLKAAKTLGDMLIVCLNSDDSVRRLKGPSRPLNGEEDRAEVLAALASVDYVIIFTEDTPCSILEKIKPKIHVKGGDYTEENLPEAEAVKKGGGSVKFIPLVEGRSTTNLIDKINCKNFK